MERNLNELTLKVKELESKVEKLQSIESDLLSQIFEMCNEDIKSYAFAISHAYTREELLQELTCECDVDYDNAERIVGEVCESA